MRFLASVCPRKQRVFAHGTKWQNKLNIPRSNETNLPPNETNLPPLNNDDDDDDLPGYLPSDYETQQATAMMMYSSDTFFIDDSPTSVPPRVEITVPDELPQPSNESSDDSKHDGHRDGYEGAPVALIPDRNAPMEGPQNTPNEAKQSPPRMPTMERSAPRLQSSSGPGTTRRSSDWLQSSSGPVDTPLRLQSSSGPAAQEGTTPRLQTSSGPGVESTAYGINLLHHGIQGTGTQ
jgi:hypothetical protein